MNKATVSGQEISKDRWNSLFASITEEFRGAHARVEVYGAEIGDQVETENRPFQGIAADDKDGENVIWMDFGDLTHGVHGVKSLRMAPRVGDAGPVIEVEAEDGTTTLLTLANPGSYELPAGEKR
jgi:Family of unknown function (DUF5335)